ncbi:MAG TPA: NlpC/P60 family protein [Patescibacteria group bacterium]|jgi:hypothetical protein|nr:NlpC/P60 family protein [Patescibacteria group bacterium]
MNIAQLFAFFAAKNHYASYIFGGLLNFCTHNVEYIGQKAVVTKPVVDMSSSFPLCYNPPALGGEVQCRRANQALYNETVDCIAVIADAVKIDYQKGIYGHDENGNNYSTMWIPQDGLALLKNIDPILLPMIPCMKKLDQPKLFLTTPWHNFSVGSYFVRIPTKDTDSHYAIFLPNFIKKTFTIEYIPQEQALCVDYRKERDARSLFVALLHKLIEYAAEKIEDGVIPYVWGGSSFITANKKDDFLYTAGAWHRPCYGQIYTGYDCSGLIWRLAQCAGIPFPWKVSKMMALHCRPINENEILEIGDIIWFEGHVMVVADIEKNILIEAAGYKNGYGQVQLMYLNERFQGVISYTDLIHAYKNECPISLLAADGSEIKKVVIILLKLTPPYLPIL